MDEFLFVGREEGLGDGVVETIPGAAHGTADVVVLAVRGEFGRCELGPTVGVKDRIGGWTWPASMAMVSASVTRLVRMCGASCQPTTMRVARSRTTAR